MFGKCRYFNQILVNKLDLYLAPLKSDIRLNKTTTNNLVCRFSSSATIETPIMKSNSFEFSNEEQAKILQVLNNESEEYFER